MTIRDRQTKLLSLVAVFPLKINVLAKMLGVSDCTIRSDIDYLSSRNRVIKNERIGKCMTVSAV